MDNPVLYPGDKIHLAIPIDPTPSKREATQQSEELGSQMARLYKQLGVEVAFWSCNSNLTHPVVVAIFRKKEEGESE